MKRLILALFIAAIGVAAGWFAAQKMPAHKEPVAASNRKVLFYQSAMHPWIKSDKPGKCTICGMDLVPVYEGDKGFDVVEGVVTLSGNSVTVINVQTSKVEKRPLKRTLRIAGVIEDDDTRHRVLSAYVEGRIDKLFVNYIGAEVKAGQPLATFYSPMLLATEREYTSLLRQAQKNDFADLTRERNNLVAAARLRLHQYGLNDGQIDQLKDKAEDAIETELLAPMTGTVVARQSYEGQYVKEGDRLFEIADYSTMWFQFDAYERDLSWLKIGQSVDVTTPAVPGKVFSAKITFIDPTINDPTRSAKVRVEIPNPLIEEGGKSKRELYHRLYAEGMVNIEIPETLTIARSAVLSPANQPVVYVEKNKSSFEQRRVKLGRAGDEYWEVLEGLSPGENVVTEGNLLIDAQAQLNQSAHQADLPATNTAPQLKLAALTGAQMKVAKDFLTLADALTTALGNDDLKAFNEQAMKLHAAIPELSQALQGVADWETLAGKIGTTGHLTEAKDIASARAEFYPFSMAVVGLAQAIRQQPEGVATLKIFECPMAGKVVPGAEQKGRWFQLQGVIHNPFYGAAMIDCGTEAKP